MKDFSEHPAFRRIHWRIAEGVQTACNAVEATHVEIEVRRGAYRTSFEFRLPGERHEADKLVSMLNDAFDFGRDRTRVELRQFLGIER